MGGERYLATSQTPARASFAFATERMTRFHVVRERVYRSTSTSFVKLLRRDYDVIQVEARRSERAVTADGNYANILGTARTGECETEREKATAGYPNPR